MARTPAPPRGRLILDSGAIIGWSRADREVRELLRLAIARNLELWVAVVVLAETLRGGARDAAVNRVLKSTGTRPTDAGIGRRAGELLGRTGRRNIADALVAAEAIQVTGSAVLTSDPDDLGALLADHPEVEVVRV